MLLIAPTCLFLLAILIVCLVVHVLDERTRMWKWIRDGGIEYEHRMAIQYYRHQDEMTALDIKHSHEVRVLKETHAKEVDKLAAD